MTTNQLDYDSLLVKAKQTVYQPKVRTTFGILDPQTKQKYPDIIKCHLEARRIQLEEWLIDKTITESINSDKPFTLLLDHVACKELVMKGYIDAMVSFQSRKDGNYAIVRLFDPKRVMLKTDI